MLNKLISPRGLNIFHVIRPRSGSFHAPIVTFRGRIPHSASEGRTSVRINTIWGIHGPRESRRFRISSGMPGGAVMFSRGRPHGLRIIGPLKIPDGKISLRLTVVFLTILHLRSAITLHDRTLLRRQLRAAPIKVIEAETKVTAPMFAGGKDGFLLRRTGIDSPAPARDRHIRSAVPCSFLSIPRNTLRRSNNPMGIRSQILLIGGGFSRSVGIRINRSNSSARTGCQRQANRTSTRQCQGPLRRGDSTTRQASIFRLLLHLGEVHVVCDS
jgi:hypothetical protein